MKPLDKEILRLALPSILANITVPLVGLVDTAVAGHLHSAAGTFGQILAKLTAVQAETSAEAESGAETCRGGDRS